MTVIDSFKTLDSLTDTFDSNTQHAVLEKMVEILDALQAAFGPHLPPKIEIFLVFSHDSMALS